MGSPGPRGRQRLRPSRPGRAAGQGRSGFRIFPAQIDFPCLGDFATIPALGRKGTGRDGASAGTAPRLREAPARLLSSRSGQGTSCGRPGGGSYATTAPAASLSYLHTSAPGPRDVSAALSANDVRFLVRLQRQGLAYFLENQMPSGLILDRQPNHGRDLVTGLCSLASTGMGLIALALAARRPTGFPRGRRSAASGRPCTRRWTAAARPRHRCPTSSTPTPASPRRLRHPQHGRDRLAAGRRSLGRRLPRATRPGGLPRPGSTTGSIGPDWASRDPARRPGPAAARPGQRRPLALLPLGPDQRRDGFLYVLAAGAADGRAIAAACLGGPEAVLRHRRPGGRSTTPTWACSSSSTASTCSTWRPGETPAGVGPVAEARWRRRPTARPAAGGRGPSPPTAASGACPPATARATCHADAYRCYTPAGPIDGTAHLTATVGRDRPRPRAVLENLRAARDPPARPRPLRLQQPQPRPPGSAATWSASTPAPPSWPWTTSSWPTASATRSTPCRASAVPSSGSASAAGPRPAVPTPTWSESVLRERRGVIGPRSQAPAWERPARQAPPARRAPPGHPRRSSFKTSGSACR